MWGLFFTENFDFFKLLKLLGLQNGKKIEGDTADGNAFSNSSTPIENNEERTDDFSPQKDFTAQVLERHERLVNKIKSKKY